MLTSQTYDYNEIFPTIEENETDFSVDENEIFPIIEEDEKEKEARLNRLRVWKIRVELRKIDRARIRPMAAIETNTATDYDHNKLTELESQAQTLREELATLTE